jgi:hypothetical protein
LLKDALMGSAGAGLCLEYSLEIYIVPHIS